MHTLLITAELEERNYLAHALRHNGLMVTLNAQVPDMHSVSSEKPFDLVVLGPNTVLDAGLQIAQLRAFTQIPIVVIVDQPTEHQHCQLLDEGADIVLQRPASLRLLTRYVQVLVRRAGNVPAALLAPIEADYIVLDPRSRSVTVENYKPQRLTQLEFRLLYILMANQGQVVPVDELVEKVWGYNGEGNRDLVRGLVRRLRKKIEPASDKPFFIHNLPGVGYRFATE